MFCKLPTTRLREDNRVNPSRSRAYVTPSLEELESRLTPSPISIATVTNASVQIIPNLSSFTVTEKVTATVTATSVPPGIPVPSGAVSFNLNNQQQQANLDASGHATATFTLPLLALFTSQELTVKYPGASIASPSAVTFESSTFNAPLYLNFDNLLFAATVSFGPPPAQSPSGAPVYNTAQGETDDFGLFSFQYVDPGLIASVRAFGQDFPGFFAAALGAYGPEFMNNGGSKS